MSTPAFPSEGWSMDGTPLNETGMTLRDYFAAKALQSFIMTIPNGIVVGVGSEEMNLGYARAAYAMANAMLEAREET